MACDPESVISSTDLTNLKSDITTIDDVVESSLDTTTTKSGKVINTLLGQLKLLGYEAPVTYAGGISFTTSDNTKTVDESGVIYAPLPSALPFTTSGTFVGDDDARFFVVQGLTSITGVTKTELAAGGGVITLVNYADSVTDLEAMTLPAGAGVYLTEAAKNGLGVIKSGTAPADASKYIYIPISGGNYWERQTGKIQSDLSFSVGASGTFATITAALSVLRRFSPENGATVTLTLETGFVLEEQVYVEAVDLSWVTIESTDATVSINGASTETDTILVDGTNVRYAFGAVNGKLPRINVLFIFDGTGTAINRMGLAMAKGSSSVWGIGAGIRTAPLNAMHIDAAYVFCRGSEFTGSIGRNAYIFNGSFVDAEGANFSGSGSDNVLVTRNSQINLTSADCSSATVNGVLATQGSVVNAGEINAANCGSAGLRARGASVINANSGDVSGSFDGIYADRKSVWAITDDTVPFNASGCTRYGLFIRGGANVYGNNINANDSRVFVEQGGILSAPNLSSTGARDAAPALEVVTGGVVSCPTSTITNTGTGAASGIKCDGAQVEANGSTISSTNQIALYSLDGGIINANESIITATANAAIFAAGGDVIARKATFNVVSNKLIETIDGSNVDIASATVTRTGTAPASSILLRDGAHVNASGVTGENPSVTANTITASGILIL